MAGQPFCDRDQIEPTLGRCRRTRGVAEKTWSKRTDPRHGQTTARAIQLSYAEQALGHRPQPGMLDGAAVNKQQEAVRLLGEGSRESVRWFSHEAIGQVDDGRVIVDERGCGLSDPRRSDRLVWAMYLTITPVPPSFSTHVRIASSAGGGATTATSVIPAEMSVSSAWQTIGRLATRSVHSGVSGVASSAGATTTPLVGMHIERARDDRAHAVGLY